MVEPERISRFLSYLLRHRPTDHPLAFDSQGFAGWREIVATVQARLPDVTEDEIRAVIQGSNKKRFELAGEKIRATYGHSFPVDLTLQSVEPPAELYHGTARDLAQSILRDGLQPRGRQYVHLSRTVDEALAVGGRRDPFPAIIVVAAKTAHARGVRFFSSGPLFLAEKVPAEFLSSYRR